MFREPPWHLSELIHFYVRNGAFSILFSNIYWERATRGHNASLLPLAYFPSTCLPTTFLFALLFYAFTLNPFWYIFFATSWALHVIRITFFLIRRQRIHKIKPYRLYSVRLLRQSGIPENPRKFLFKELIKRNSKFIVLKQFHFW